MCKEMLVIPVDRVVDKKRVIGKSPYVSKISMHV
jgi:hypothetical protein